MRMQHTQHAQGRDVRSLCISRRQAAVAAVVALTGGSAARPGLAAQLVEQQQPLAAASPGSSCGSLDPRLAAAFMQAVYATVQQQQVMPEQQLQLERFKLQEREFKYYSAANKDRMPALPDLTDNSGGLSNRLFYNFVSYVLWKVVARHLSTPEARTHFCEGVGQQLLQQLAPDMLEQVRAATAAAGLGGRAPAADLVAAMQQLLQQLQQRGYLCSWQLVMGSLPGGWPADWDRQGGLVDDEGQLLLLSDQPLPSGTVFQVKLKLPADIEGSVALRAEEDGFWSRHVSSMLLSLLDAAGYPQSNVDEFFYQDNWSGPRGLGSRLLLLFGDPLQQVDVPWTPTTLVQDWTLA